MELDRTGAERPGYRAGGSAGFTDARYSQGVIVGDGNTQNITIYKYRGMSPDRPAPAPLIDAGGRVEFPYRGLGWFGEHDAPLFFGRDPAITDVLHQLSEAFTEPRIVAVGGVSGSGKSSLMRAGVLPRIRSGAVDGLPGADRWPPFVVFSPGSSPLDDLADATASATRMDAATLRRELRHDPTGFAATAAQATTVAPGAPPDGGRRLLVVVDQFERIFTQCTDPNLREGFVGALHAAATTPQTETGTPPALVVLVVRSDFEAHCAELEGLAEAIRHRCMLTSMTERQLRLAITEPAKTAGSRVEDELTEQLLREVRAATRITSNTPTAVSGAGVLPLVSDALDRAWRQRAGDNLTATDYDRVGGIDRAVAHSAQRTYDDLTPEQQVVARTVFTRLTVVGPDGTDTADRARRSDLTEIAGEAVDVEAVLEAFAAERLLTLGDDSVEISHEVLLSTWPLLRDEWLADTRADRAVRTRLHNAASVWDEHGRDNSYLFTGTVLDTTTATVARIITEPDRHTPLTDLEHRFLTASTRAARRRAAFTATLVLLVVALTVVAAGVLIKQTWESDKQRKIAVAQNLISRSQLLYTTDPYGSRVAALAAWRIHQSDETFHAIRHAASNPRTAKLTGHTSTVNAVAFSPDGHTLATGSGSDNTVRLWDPATGEQIGEPLIGHTGSVVSVAFSPDSPHILATGSSDDTVRLWDPATGEQIGGPLIGHTGGVVSVAFSRDGHTLATGGSDDTVRLWDPATGGQIGQLLIGHTGGIASVAFSPDGDTLATGSWNSTVRLWDPATGEQIGGPLIGHTGSVVSVAFSPDSPHILATGSSDSTVRLWNLATGGQIGQLLTGHTGGIASVAFSPDGHTLATGSSDSTVRLWYPTTGEQISETLIDHTGNAASVAFSPDGHTLATAGGSNDTVQLLESATGEQIGELLTGHTGGVVSVAFSRDGHTLATGGGSDNTVRLWNPATGEQIGQLLTGHTSGVASVAFSRDGHTLATGGSSDNTVRLWDPATGEQIGEPLIGHTDMVVSVAFSPDGHTLATGSSDSTVRLWDPATGEQIGEPLIGHTDMVVSVAFSPDGHTLTTGGSDDTVRLWNIGSADDVAGSLCRWGGQDFESAPWPPDVPTDLRTELCP
ncbi:WD40 repeat domain-containing protein [Nocardia speluncae]|uniref:WD40 repeat domain-containing protein n=2 Tax=Nocardia speluncae TaxID=419477 RepID=A0A846XC58_9NOCA|nr:WD40 repeat domain-containing protein [Nocardia speluncae]NKY33921.1 WD40 repeat domain-containing protein [Nocardia speluncae]